MKCICLIALAVHLLLIRQFCEGQVRGCPVAFSTPGPMCKPSANSKYRPVDGKLKARCTSTGKSFARYDRLEKAHYDDCEWEMRRAVSQKDLPPVRKVVNKVCRAFRRDLTFLKRIPNFFSAMIGQYIAHDISSKADAKAANETIECCINRNERPVQAEVRHPSCLVIDIPRNDPDYGQNVQCLGNVFRSKTMPQNSPSDQTNEVTAFVDNSNLYGSTNSVAESLRTGRGGRMVTNAKNIMPERDNKFYLGDARLNQTPQLQVLHSIQLREHNRIAGILQGMNRHWKDKKLFEETRRIVIAQFQHVVYEEFLPAYIDPGITKHLDNPLFGPNFDAAVFNEFSSSVFRVMHSFIPTQVHLISKDDTIATHKLHKILNNVQIIRTHYDDIVRGLLVQPIHVPGYDPELFHGMFKNNDTDPGLDLVSVDLIRGRDHGLPPYANILKDLRGNTPITKFQHLSPFISDENIELLRHTYEAVEDIDLLVGALLETPMNGSLLGPTAQSMFFSQFRRLMTADPYFYTNPDSPKPFTTRQLQEISKASSNLLFCMNSGVEWVPRTPSISPATVDDLIPCSSLKKISYESWRER